MSNRAVLLHHLVIFAITLLLFAGLMTTPVLAEINCGQGALCCSGTESCKKLEMSGTCNGPITCSGPGQPCGCVAKFKGAATNSLNQKKPLSKSQ
jgi:hypothetical protein